MSEEKRSLLLMLRTGDDQARTLGEEIRTWLAGRQVEASVCEHNVCGGFDSCTPPVGLPWAAVLVLGGDGTFIGVARACLHLGIPLLGLNLGRVGFLAEGASNWPRRVEALLRGDYRLSRRVCLSYEVTRGSAQMCAGVAVNDVVASRGDMARLIRLSVSRAGEHVGSMRADGLIVSTPTGSTAYGNSAGGPLVHPDMQAFCLTPVCPFLNTFSPMVLPCDKELEILVEEQRGEVRLTIDGQLSFGLEQGDVLRVRRSSTDLLMAHTGRDSYFAKLASKGFFTQR
jgi:NAD+ kinase